MRLLLLYVAKHFLRRNGHLMIFIIEPVQIDSYIYMPLEKQPGRFTGDSSNNS